MLPINISFENVIRLLQDSGNFYLVKVNNNGDYVYMNSHFTTRHSAFYKPGDVKPASIALHPDDYAISYETYLKCVENPHKIFDVTLRKLDGKGGYIITYWEYKANYSQEGIIDGIIGVGHDITAFESRKDHIRFLTATLNSVAHQQSHSLRRPLANVIGLIEVLETFEIKEARIAEIVTLLRQSCIELNEEIELFMIKDIPDGPPQNN